MNRTTWLQDRRMQKFRDVLSRWERKELSAMEACELLGCSERQFQAPDPARRATRRDGIAFLGRRHLRPFHAGFRALDGGLAGSESEPSTGARRAAGSRFQLATQVGRRLRPGAATSRSPSNAPSPGATSSSAAARYR